MAETEQQRGERQVREVLIAPLRALIGQPPKGTRVKDLDRMLDALCARLWRLPPGALEDIRARIEASQDFVDNRWPTSGQIIRWAQPKQPGGWPPSDRMIRLFRHEIGQAAIKAGWAPELYEAYVGTNTFPNDYAAGLIVRDAGPAMRRMADLTALLRSGNMLTDRDRSWYDFRRDRIDLCRRIADYRQEGAA